MDSTTINPINPCEIVVMFTNLGHIHIKSVSPSRPCGRCFRNVGDVKGRVLDAALKEALRLNSGADGEGLWASTPCYVWKNMYVSSHTCRICNLYLFCCIWIYTAWYMFIGIFPIYIHIYVYIYLFVRIHICIYIYMSILGCVSST